MRKIIIELLNSLYDLINFLRYSFKEGNLKNKEHYIAFLTKQYHIIEKGLALPNPRLGFGVIKIGLLLEESSQYIKRYGEDDLTKSIISVLKEYVSYHTKNNYSSELIIQIEKFITDKQSNDLGGTRKLSSIEYSDINFDSFFKSRRSIRDFTSDEVSNSLLMRALEIAKYTPSVCNRQGWKLHILKGDDARKVLYLQGGNSGFSESINTIGIITGDIHYFTSSERNQIGIDAGMFSMSYILALHSLHIGTCALNACVSLRIEQKINKIINIPQNEKIVMWLAIGYPKVECNVALSNRRNTESFINFH